MSVDTLDVFLAHTEGAWQRGVNDCFVAAANQLTAWYGKDPMARYRGRYRSMSGYLRVIREDGYTDAQAAFKGELSRAGFLPAIGYQFDGDVALASYLEQGKPTVAPALYFDGFWHVRSKSGWLCFSGSAGILEIYRYGA